ncbi:hypothetical protein JCM8097_008838 [Rhodosporidiobolus ruineniae]
MADHRVLSEHPLNSEPPSRSLLDSYLTPVPLTYHRNHQEIPHNYSRSTITVSSEVPSVQLSRSAFTLDELHAATKESAIVCLACAGNRRMEMNKEKEVEGLQWGAGAIANCEFSGPLLSDILGQAGLTLEKVDSLGLADKLHIHFETTFKCQDDDYFGASLPIKLALDPARPVMLAYEQNGEPLTEDHGAPLRVVVPGVVGARSVKWLERIIVRNHESDNFYQKRDYKVLPPEATSENKEEYMKQTPPLMEYPLNSEICEPSEAAVVEFSDDKPSILVRGYAMGVHGIPISSVHVTLLTLPLSPSALAASDSAISDLHRLRLAASALPSSSWSSAKLITASKGSAKHFDEGEKNWGWTLWTAEVEVEEKVRKLAELGVGGEGTEVALVAYANDVEGNKQELQTPYNLRGVAEASWSVVTVKLRKAVGAAAAASS